MITREDYKPGSADVAHVEKNGDNWTLVLEKNLRHSPDKVWQALTDPAELRQWAPFDSDANLGSEGAKAKLTTVGAPQPHVTETEVTRAEYPRLLEYKWGDFDMRWQLDEAGQGTRLTLWTNIARPYIAMGAAGWQICLDVLDSLLNGEPIGRIVGPEAMKFEGWQRLNKEYSEKFGIQAPSWS